MDLSSDGSFASYVCFHIWQDKPACSKAFSSGGTGATVGSTVTGIARLDGSPASSKNERPAKSRRDA